MSKRLEDFIHDNREEFDDLTPRAALWDNIEKQLSFKEMPKKREVKTFSLGFVLRLAAMIIMVMGIGFVVYLRNEKRTGGVDLAAINPEYAQQQKHYASLVKEKRHELLNVAKTDPQLYQEFSIDLAKMDSTYKKLTNELKTSPNQERVLRAMIRNLQVQSEVLNQQLQIIEQFNQQKNQDNENKSI
ncbi:hypothetical protein [Mucilaginibacter sp. KACC 22063]|uniref:hypothetical protein n=1 Tax=Mucilaginibacter sp. KACC 22063 TaxID=3025666 RepID=UPI0023667FCF|nr:hypothetical protein [Mucilaginibacter sp. KACC 22063]WDF55967.1 hypothetical protein PQ461_02700 [Mucilaginibacter sp. KACC 22063]